MKAKATLKILVDIAMTALFLGQMGYHMMDNRLHEITGVTLCALFIVHHALNGGWHRGLLRGRYSAQRVLLTAIDILLMLAMLAIMTSAVLVSRHVFSFLGLHMRALGRRIHMPATMWAFVLMGLHLGLHWNLVLQRARRRVKGGLPRAGLIVLRVAVVGLCALGACEFIRRGLWMEMFSLREFAFLDYGETLPVFLASYIAILILWAALSHDLGKAVRALGRRTKRAKEV